MAHARTLRLVRDEEVASPEVATDLVSVYRAYSRYVAAIALRLIGRDEDVDDIVQEVFLIAMRGLRDVREPAALRGWLATVTVRIARRKLRRRKLRAFVGLDAAPDHAKLVVDAPQDKAVLILRVYAALELLPVDDRIAWTLRNVEGESLDDVAHITGCSLATVKRRIARAQAALDLEVLE